MHDKETVEPDDLDKLIYMHQVFEETLRLYPTASAIAREAPDNFNMCGYAIPKGSTILVSCMNITFALKWWCRYGIFACHWPTMTLYAIILYVKTQHN